MNLSERRITSAKDWDFLWRQYTKSTVAGERSIKLPRYTNKPQGIYLTVGSYRYTPTEVTTRQEWDKLNTNDYSSDIATYYFVYDGSIELYPIPASVNTVTFNARRVTKDLSQADYTTGTITTVATSGIVTTVTGDSTVWTDAMVGRHIRIDTSDLALSTSGDGYWYEIATVTSNTSLTLVKTYGGTAMTGAAATYTIGETSLMPEEHDVLPVYEALKIYYTSTDPNKSQAELYGQMAVDGYDLMFRDQGSKRNVVLDTGEGYNDFNPNAYITL